MGRDENAPAASSPTSRRRRGSLGSRSKYTQPPFKSRECGNCYLLPCIPAPVYRRRAGAGSTGDTGYRLSGDIGNSSGYRASTRVQLALPTGFRMTSEWTGVPARVRPLARRFGENPEGPGQSNAGLPVVFYRVPASAVLLGACFPPFAAGSAQPSDVEIVWALWRSLSRAAGTGNLVSR